MSSMTSGGKFISARKFFKTFGVNTLHVQNGQLRLTSEKLERWGNLSLLTFIEVGETQPHRSPRGTA